MHIEPYIVSDFVISPLAVGSNENYIKILSGNSGLKIQTDMLQNGDSFCVSTIHGKENMDSKKNPGFFEEQLILTAKRCLENADIPVHSNRNLLLLASTKGDINFISASVEKGKTLPDTAKAVAYAVGFTTNPMVISNACVSGLMALIIAKRLIQNGNYDNVLVLGGDLVSKFVLTGFQSFNALSTVPCRPFDRDRTGLNLGEAFAAALVSSNPYAGNGFITKIAAGFSSNDANHISGPSMDGEGLFRCLEKIKKELKAEPQFINAHGTATPYNDEMEATAFSRAGLSLIPVNSLKGYFGHTLGTAGLLESIMSIHAMHNGELIPSAGYQNNGVTQPLQIILSPKKMEINSFLKTASGFGGTNATALFEK